MIQNIIFDVAKVLMEYQPEEYAAGLGGDPQKMQEAVRASMDYPDWYKIDLGTVSEEETFRNIALANPGCAREIQLFHEHWYEMFQPMEGMEELLERLQKAGYRLYYLSNFPQRAFEYVKEKLGAFRYADKGLVSYEVELVKPDPAIYRAMLDRFGLQAEQSVFTDDRPANTAAAAALGFSTHTFTTARRFEEYLLGLGLKF